MGWNPVWYIFKIYIEDHHNVNIKMIMIINIKMIKRMIIVIRIRIDRRGRRRKEANE